MNYGQGGIVRTNKIPPSGSPFTAGSARNGLSVDATGHIVIGQQIGEAGNPARLLDNREIPINLHSLDFLGSLFGPTHLTIDNKSYLNWLTPYPLNAPNNTVLTPFQTLATKTGTGGLVLASYLGASGPLTDGIEIGTAVTLGAGSQYLNGSFINAKGANGGPLNITSALALEVYQGADLPRAPGSNKFFSIDRIGGQILIGDIDGVQTGSLLQVDNISGSNYAIQDGDFQIRNVAGTELIFDALQTGGGGITVQMGDLANLHNGTKFTVDDVGMTATAAVLTFEVSDPTFVGTVAQLHSNPGNVQALLGDIANSGNGSVLLIADLIRTLQFAVGGVAFATIDAQNKQYTFGEAAGSRLQIDEAGGFATLIMIPGGKGNFLTVDDTNDKIEVGNVANNIKMNINGVNGFTGTVLAPTSITVNGGIVTAVT